MKEGRNGIVTSMIYMLEFMSFIMKRSYGPKGVRRV